MEDNIKLQETVQRWIASNRQPAAKVIVSGVAGLAMILFGVFAIIDPRANVIHLLPFWASLLVGVAALMHAADSILWNDRLHALESKLQD